VESSPLPQAGYTHPTKREIRKVGGFGSAEDWTGEKRAGILGL
jgi:hypothetical protein